MKKGLGILAMVVFAIGMVSCEAENSVEETEALFTTLNLDTNAVDGKYQDEDERED